MSYRTEELARRQGDHGLAAQPAGGHIARMILSRLIGPAALLSAVGGTVAAAQTRHVDLRLTEGTNIAAALSLDGQTIAIDLLGRIWTLPRAGGTAKVLTDEFGDARQPAWSPDGKRIAFQSYRDGTWHIWSVGADGSSLRQHTLGEFDHREPTWSPDGTSLLFSSDRSGNYDIWRQTLASGRLERLTSDPADEFGPSAGPDGSVAFVSAKPGAAGIWLRDPNGTTALWAAAEGRVAGPSISPDGGTIVYNVIAGGGSELRAAERGQPSRLLSAAGDDVFPFRAAWTAEGTILYTSDGKIAEVRPDGTRLGAVPFDGRITFDRTAYQRARRDFDGTRPEPVRGILSPTVAPDGRSYAFVALGDLWRLTAGGLERLTTDLFVEADPQFSPDGTRLVYATDRGGSMELWLRDLATGADRQLTKSGGAALPAWAPDGARIVFQVQRGIATEIHSVGVTTGVITPLRTNLFGPSRATFSPDGRFVAIAALRANSAKYREGRNDILIMPSDGSPDRWVIPPAGRGVGARGIDGPVWSPDGKRMAFILDGLVWSQPVESTGEPAGPPTRHSDELANSLSWTGDGSRLVFQATKGLRNVDLSTGAVEPIAIPLTWRRSHPARTVTIHAGRMWDGRAERLRTNVDIVVTGHRITAIRPHRRPAPGDSVIDASGLTVMPGLADAHAHIGYGAGEALGRTWLAYGITTVRDPASDPFAIRERREAVESGARIGPRELATGRIFDGQRIYYGFNNAMTPGAQLTAELVRAAELRFDLIKTYVRLPDLLQYRIIEAAHRIGIPVSSHELYPAVAFGGDHVEHISGTSRRGYSPKMSGLSRSYQDVIGLLTASGMTLTPTMSLQGGFGWLTGRDTTILNDPRLTLAYGADYVRQLRQPPPPQFRVTPAMITSLGQTVSRVIDGGGVVIAGTDAPIIPYGLSLHTELMGYVEGGGLTPVQALRTATSAFADAMGLGEDLGSIAVGRLADLAMVEGNPLERIADARRVKLVMKNGEAFSIEQLMAGPVKRPAAPPRR